MASSSCGVARGREIASVASGSVIPKAALALLAVTSMIGVESMGAAARTLDISNAEAGVDCGAAEGPACKGLRHLTADDARGYNPYPSYNDTYERTIVFIKRPTWFGQFVFLRGGIDHGRRDCSTLAADSDCAIPIEHPEVNTTANGPPLCWTHNDTFLDWYGAEPGQSRCYGQSAQGSPMSWTTDNADYFASVAVDGYGYTELNQFGDHVWMLDVMMDCNVTEDGWFEVKAYVVSPGEGSWWEPDLAQKGCQALDVFPAAQLSGSLPSSLSPPFAKSINHMALCGYMNVFEYDSPSCQVSVIPDAPYVADRKGAMFEM